MRVQGFRNALVVSQYFQITRSRYAMHRVGITTVHTAHPRYFELRDIYSIAREAVALPVYWLTFRSA
jgi:vancomycin permeability regulator SanA